MKKVYVLITMVGLLFAPYSATAQLIRFNAQYLSFELGYLEYDDSVFVGSGLQLITNDNITDLNFDVPGVLFGFSDVESSNAIIFDLSGLLPRLLAGTGTVATSGSRSLDFFFDGSYDPVPPTGDTSLVIGSSDPLEINPDLDVYPVTWTVTNSDLVSVPEPRTLFLLCSGLLLLSLRNLKGMTSPPR